MSDTEWFGQELTRREDDRLLTGEARYTDDLVEPGMVHAGICRSQYAHAELDEIDLSPALEIDGVVDAFIADDLDVPRTLPMGRQFPHAVNPGRPILAEGRVRYQGEPVAVVLAEDRYTAQTACDRVDIEYTPLDPVVDPIRASKNEAPTIHEEAPDNVAIEWDMGDVDAVETAFEEAAQSVSLDLTNQRLIPNALEPRAALASYQSGDDRLTLQMTTQNPHRHQHFLAATLDHPKHRIRVVAPEVGGGFGSKGHNYPDEAIVAWCSMQVGRPVKWQATRSESHLTDTHGRNHEMEVELALEDDGTFAGVRVRSHAGLGGYLSDIGPGVIAGPLATMLAGPYTTPAIHCQVTGTFTNTAPIDTYRGSGRPEATYLLERLVKKAATALQMDPAELRRRNLIPADAFPYQSPMGPVYDSGNYERALDELLEALDYEAVCAERDRLRTEDRYLGVGIATFVEVCGSGPSSEDRESILPTQMESSTVRVHPGGQVTAYCGTADHGQGHETTFAQVIADALGVDPDDIEVVEGDTESVPEGTGTFASRSAAVGGSSLVRSAEKVIDQARQVAAHQFEADRDDVVFEDGSFVLTGAPEKSMSFAEVAAEAYAANDLPDGFEPGLEATTFYDPENLTFPFGAHAAIVEVDPQSGEVELRRYVAVDDCGEQINPKIVEGQIHGGVAQGIGQALFERGNYDENGNLVTSTFQDYAIPKATHLPDIETRSTVTPCPHNPLGVKGVGESGTVPAPAAVTNAVVDALEPFGVDHVDMPITPETVWRAIDPAE